VADQPRLGYALSSEEHAPDALVRNAVLAEQAGFSYAFVSDHFHPWTDTQGQSPFVWTVLGAIARETESLWLATGVTCPILRIHPALVAQAAATAAALLPRRFALGVGTGENLNEHVVGARWPAADERREMLEEAIEVMRLLWTGEDVTYRGRHVTVDRARIYTLPDEPPPVLVAAGGPQAAELAGRAGDGLVATAPDRELVKRFEQAGEDGQRPRYGQLTVCWAESADEALETARRWWPNAALEGELGQELPTPAHFEQAVATVRAEDLAEKVVHGPDPSPYREAIAAFADAGFDHVYLHQVGPDQEGFIDFFARELAPELARAS
jgi:coenzyme F420-dependent glucose-6-phosphate dehydrogenase